MTPKESAKVIFDVLYDDFFSWTPNTVDAFNNAISALEKQTVDKCCETCKYKDRNSFEEPCDGCYFAYDFEDCYEAEEES